MAALGKRRFDREQTKDIIEDINYDDVMNARPNQNDIDKQLRDLGIKREQTPGRRLSFYFAGHEFARESDDVGMLMANASPTIALNRNMRVAWIP